ncbi:MAG: carbohydrate ABC transporter permease [Eubacteriales bacterium]|nr:carbohydrate ABC transporter permease [Eubacteriales bacterium]MDD3880995.1 carbohydrate ABC transporter permease [Eubacteriales bacterium]MDD4511936.1 carbohydrate ABC transporter permease [Eubacteriales bacterium]
MAMKKSRRKRTPLERREHLRKLLLGSNEKQGVLLNIVVYTLLISIAFIFLYPVLYMLSTSLMPKEDLLDTAAKWIPSSIYTKNYTDAMQTMDYWNSLLKNLAIAFFPTLAQVVVCSLVGYGFARYNFPLKSLLMVILMLSFLLPAQLTIMPNYVLFANLGLKGTIWAFIVPAVLGMGFKSALFILIFYNFHRQVPNVLLEAAQIDGTSGFGAYFRIAVPLSLPAVVTVILFSFVWYWNETNLTQVYLGYASSRNNGLTTLLIELQKFETSYEALYSQWDASPNKLNGAIRMAGTMLSILPLLLGYLGLQRYFIESVDKSGITGE